MIRKASEVAAEVSSYRNDRCDPLRALAGSAGAITADRLAIVARLRELAAEADALNAIATRDVLFITADDLEREISEAAR